MQIIFCAFFRLLQLSENVFSSNVHDVPPVLQVLQSHAIQDCAVGPDCIAFLLGDGRVCRVSYVTVEKLLPNVKAAEENKDKIHSSKAGRC